ncbi:MAG: (d)CMP kinase [Gammaproteobacteria bacterium]|nr:(d)CMP kinase [Gammaproteobacteria bacterium]
MPYTQPPVIAVDGPSGTGKGTLSLKLAARLGWHFLDSGVLYRLVGMLADRQAVALDDAPSLARLAAQLPLEFRPGREAPEIYLAGECVTSEVRLESTGALASWVAACPEVRGALLQRQRELRRAPGLVADGRDMGTVVFPDAQLKIFLTASPEIRAERRYKQLKGKGFDVNLARLLEDIRERDERDSKRAIAPLQPALDAEILDTNLLGIAEVEDRVMRLAYSRGLV